MNKEDYFEKILEIEPTYTDCVDWNTEELQELYYFLTKEEKK